MPSKTFFHLPAEKRERLLLAAEEEFARVPYAEASINRMIRAAGIPRGSFYMYFRDKEELFHYLLKRYQDGLLQRLERVLEEQGGDLLGALPALFDDLRAQRKHWAGLARMLSRNSDMRLGLRLQISILAGHLVGSVVINSLALHLFYGYQWALLAARIPNALVLSVVNTLLVRILLENKALTALVRKA